MPPAVRTAHSSYTDRRSATVGRSGRVGELVLGVSSRGGDSTNTRHLIAVTYFVYVESFPGHTRSTLIENDAL